LVYCDFYLAIERKSIYTKDTTPYGGSIMFAGGIGVQEIVIILIVGLLVFGAARLPKIARSLGQGIKEFKKTVKGLEDDDDEGASRMKYVQNQPPNYQGQQQYPQGPQYQQGPVQQGGQNPQYSTDPQAPNTQQNQQNPSQNQGAQSATPQGPQTQQEQSEDTKS
jgi:sec-independent protein translocase protein TatA